MNKVKYAIFTKPHHVEKIVNFLNQHTDIDYVITSDRHEVDAYDYDIGVSYCFPWLIDVDSPEHKDKMFYNYHSAPLPDYKGVHVYERAVKEKIKSWGVSLHVMTDVVDSGEILAKYTFPLKSPPVNTNEIGCIAHYELFQLFKDTVKYLQSKPKNRSEFLDKTMFPSVCPKCNKKIDAADLQYNIDGTERTVFFFPCGHFIKLKLGGKTP